MEDTIEIIICDIRNLLNDSAIDIKKKHHFAYKEYLDEYNSIINRLHKIELLKEENEIRPVEPGQRASGRSISRTEIIKHLEINDKIKRLIRKTTKFIETKKELKNYDDLLTRLFSRFHLVTRQLRNRYNNKETLNVEDEYDVQDLLHSLLKIDFDDIRPEETTPSYAGGSKRIDFLLKNEKILIEVKKTRKNLSDKEVGKELIIDISTYSSHPDCEKLYCFIYDPEGRISNPVGLISDLEKKSTADLLVRVFVEPNN